MRLLDAFFLHADTASSDPLMPASNPALLVALAAVADAVFVVDTAWRFFYLNDRAATLLGHPRAVLQGTELWVLCPELRGTVFETEFRRAVTTGHTITFEARYPGNSAASIIRAYPSPSGLVIYVRERTKQSGSAAAVRLLEPLLDQIEVAVIATDVDGRVTHWNAHATTLYGWSRAEAIGHPVGTLTVGNHDLVAEAATEARLRAGHSWSGEFTARHKNGTTFPAHVTDAPIRDATGRLQGAVGVSIDITARTGRDAALAYRATHDPLTGLPNRALFLDRLGHALDRLHRDGTACAVLFLDLDHFKQVNDTFGHGAGDALLVAVAGRLRGAVRPSDTLARLSGDEFTVLLEGVADPAEAAAVAARLAAALDKPFAVEGRLHIATTSIGIALGRPAHARPEDLLRDADAALYLAKAAGRAGHVIHDDSARAGHTPQAARAALGTSHRAATAAMIAPSQRSIPGNEQRSHGETDGAPPAQMNRGARPQQWADTTQKGPERMTPQRDDHGWPAGGGEMGALIRAHDWATTPLGPIPTWPQSLRVAVRLLLTTRHPMFIWWGPGLTQIYNDAYRATMGPERHPAALGGGGRETWAEIWDTIGPQIAQVMADRGATWHEDQLVPVTRHGRREDVWWTYGYSPIDDEAAPHGIGGVLVVCRDVTAEHAAAAELRAAHAAAETERMRLYELFAQAPTAICLLSGPDHVYTLTNPPYLTLIGRDDILGRSVREVFPELVGQGIIELLDGVYQTGEAFVGDELPMQLDRDGDGVPEEVYFTFVYAPFRATDGATEGIFVHAYEVTGQVRVRLAAEGAVRARDTFLAIAAHELRTPLTALKGTTQLLIRQRSRGTLDPERLGRGLDTLDRAADRLVALTNDLLDVAQLNTGRLALNPRQTDLATLVAESVAQARDRSDEGHHLTLAVPHTLPTAWLDATRIEQVLTNLLDNALKYSPAGGTVTVTVKADATGVTIAVRDMGIGLPTAALELIFAPFGRASNAESSTLPGLGLGLAISRTIVERHGGWIAAASAGEGHGTTITFWLPFAGTISMGGAA